MEISRYAKSNFYLKDPKNYNIYTKMSHRRDSKANTLNKIEYLEVLKEAERKGQERIEHARKMRKLRINEAKEQADIEIQTMKKSFDAELMKSFENMIDSDRLMKRSYDQITAKAIEQNELKFNENRIKAFDTIISNFFPIKVEPNKNYFFLKSFSNNSK